MKQLTNDLKKQALHLGFSAVGITGAEVLSEAADRLIRWIEDKKQGSMEWLANSKSQRPDPTAFFPQTQSVIIVVHNYYRSNETMISPVNCGTISLYARGRDYHKVLRKKLKKLLDWIILQNSKTRGRIFVDSFPVMEKPLAVRAGLGWVAKNSNIILKGKGSYFFLGGILLNLDLPADPPFSGEHCGNCNRCQQACPTSALSDDFILDANRCISYLTIEHRGAVDESLKKLMGNYIFGCDICQMVCPWNKSPEDTGEMDFHNRFDEEQLRLSYLSSLTEISFKKMFEGTPVLRAGYDRFMRNILIAQRNIHVKKTDPIS